jgi:hypothetical protein
MSICDRRPQIDGEIVHTLRVPIDAGCEPPMTASESEWRRVMKFVAVAMIAGVLALQLSSAARADDRYAKACLKNETTANIKYSWRFGDDPWKQKDIMPQQQDIVSFTYPTVGVDKSPFLYIEYDSKISGHKVETKKLELFAAAGNDNCNQAKTYVFRIEPTDANFINLLHTN